MKKKSNQILLVIVLLMVLAFTAITFITAKGVYNKKVAEETVAEPDFYAMTDFSADNSKAVMKALKSESAEKLGGLMIDPQGADTVAGYAAWSDADFNNAVSLGAGSFSVAPDKKGRMDISERFVVSIGEQKYVLFIETITSRHGMNNDGVSVVAATTYERFVELDSGWNGEKDDISVVAGQAFVPE